MRINIIIIITASFSLLSCKKSTRKEIVTSKNFKQEIVYKNDSVISSKTYNIHNKILLFSFNYKKNNIDEMVEYYPNGKVKILSKLTKYPNHFTDKGYFISGKLEYEGETDYIKGKKYRRSWWVFYNEDSSVNSLVEFANDGKGNEWILQKKEAKK